MSIYQIHSLVGNPIFHRIENPNEDFMLDGVGEIYRIELESQTQLNVLERVALLAKSLFHSIAGMLVSPFLPVKDVEQMFFKAEWERNTAFSGVSELFNLVPGYVPPPAEQGGAPVQPGQQYQPAQAAPVQPAHEIYEPYQPARAAPIQPAYQIYDDPYYEPAHQVPVQPGQQYQPAQLQSTPQPQQPVAQPVHAAGPATVQEVVYSEATQENLPTSTHGKVLLRLALERRSFVGGGHARTSENSAVRKSDFNELCDQFKIRHVDGVDNPNLRESVKDFAQNLEVKPNLFVDPTPISVESGVALIQSACTGLQDGYSRIVILESSRGALLVRANKFGDNFDVEILDVCIQINLYDLYVADVSKNFRPLDPTNYQKAVSFLSGNNQSNVGGLHRIKSDQKNFSVRTYLVKKTS